MLKVAVAGSNGLAQLIAHYISTTTSHQFVLMSRRPVPGLSAKGWQVLVVDYNDTNDLRFKLAGIDLVISTISGPAQLKLIDAAASAHVQRFVPSEFGGPPDKRPGTPDRNLQDEALRRLSRLQSPSSHHQHQHQHQHQHPHGHPPHGHHQMAYTIFTCGVLYERFAPGGLAASQIAGNYNSTAVGVEGKYLLDIRHRRALLPPYTTSDGHEAMVCLTGARDVAQFVVSALSSGLPLSSSSWPREFRICGERLSLRALVAEAEQALDCLFPVSQYTWTSLTDAVTSARAIRDQGSEMQLQQLIDTAQGRYDFTDFNMLHVLGVVNYQPEKFRDYLARVWASPSPLPLPST